MENKIMAEAEYADIILALLYAPYNITSIIKLVFMAFCIKYTTNTKIYNRRKKDFIDVFIGSLDVKLISHLNDFKLIFDVLNKLQDSGFIIIDEDEIKVIKQFSFESENSFLNYCKSKENNPILEANKLTPRAFMEEVLRYV